MTGLMLMVLLAACTRSGSVRDAPAAERFAEAEQMLRAAVAPGTDPADPPVDDLGRPLVRPLPAHERCGTCLFGLMDTRGNWLVPPRFDYAEAMYRDGAWVSTGGRWSLIGPDASSMIQDALGTFPLGVRDGAAVFLPAGQQDASPRACMTSDGAIARFVIAKAVEKPEKYLYDPEGSLLATGAEFTACAGGTILYASSPSEASPGFPPEEGWRAGTDWWMLDTRTGVRRPLAGVVAVSSDRSAELRGAPSLPLALDLDTPDSNHVFDGSLGRVVGSTSGEACCFGDGIEATPLPDGLWQYRDVVTGNVLLDHPIGTPGVFRDGFAAVRLSGDQAWSLVDRNGRIAWQSAVESLEGPSGGVLVGKVGDSSGYLDLRGDWIVPPIFSFAAPFVEGAFWTRAMRGDRVFLIGKDGRIRAMNWQRRSDYVYWPEAGPMG